MGHCEVVSDSLVKLHLSPEDRPINNSPWYAFKVSEGQGILKVELHYKLHGHRYHPKVSFDGGEWEPMAESQIEMSEDKTRVSLSIPVNQAPVWVAAQELVVQADYDRWLSQLADRHGGKRSTLGHSHGGRPIYALESESSAQSLVILLGRAHPPEVPGALAMRHFVERLFEHPDFPATHQLFIVPLLNPDGVSRGFWRHGLGGMDLNRDWGPFSQPETKAVIKALNKRIADGMNPVLMLDFHSTRRNLFYTQSEEESQTIGNFSYRWLAEAKDRGVYSFEQQRRHNKGKPTSKNYFYQRFNIPAITYEVGDETPRAEVADSSRVFADAMVKTLVADMQPTELVDVRIVGGFVVDGTASGGQPDRIVDIVDDRIVYVGPMRPGKAKRILDVEGRIVAPGFIDPHTHTYSDLSEPGTSSNLPYLYQGVSTVFIGNDGGIGVGRVQEIMQNLSSRKMGTNVGIFAGHASIRREVLGDSDSQPNEVELQTMMDALAEDMAAGALGLSTGLFYAPGSFAAIDEIVSLSKVAARHGGIYDSHIRDESDYSIGLAKAVAEAIEIGRQAGIPVHIAHIKALGPGVHGQSETIVKLVEQAHEKGVKVTADQYPWLASGTRLSNALIPKRLMTGGAQGLKEQLNDAEIVQGIQAEMVENLRRRGGSDAILITGDSPHRGRTLAEVAKVLGVESTMAAVQVVIDGDPAIASFVMHKDDAHRLMRQPWVVTSSDGTRGHPRKYASFPKKFTQYVQEGKVLDLVSFIHRSSGLTAKTFGLCDRGFLLAGTKADIVIFDPQRYLPKATYEAPEVLAEGVDFLFVNGVMAIQDGQLAQPVAGRVIDRQSCR